MCAALEGVTCEGTLKAVSSSSKGLGGRIGALLAVLGAAALMTLSVVLGSKPL